MRSIYSFLIWDNFLFFFNLVQSYKARKETCSNKKGCFKGT